MFGLSEAHYNIVKRAASNCTNEISDAIQKSGAKYDAVATAIISKHYTQVATLVTKTQFIWLAGYLKGRWGNNFDRE